jgi:oligo-1,6-glucosidase/alpha-glucosidase
MRQISKLGNSVDKAKIIATLQLTARGVPFIYYGEEIGMLNHRLPLRTAQDPVAQKYSWIPQFLFNMLTRGGHISLNRDDCRTPMQWDSSPNAGFCSKDVEPWLPIARRHETINVESEVSDPNSLMHCYKELLWLRRRMPALHSGSVSVLDTYESSKFTLTYRRIHNEQTVQVWLNFSEDSFQTNEIAENPRVLFSTIIDTAPLKGNSLHLQPYHGVILEF